MRFQCQYCQIPLKIPLELAGKKVQCPKCKNAFLIPSDFGEVSPEPQTSVLAPGPGNDIQPPSAKQSDVPYEVTCPGCRERLEADIENAGKQAPCPACQTLMRIPSGPGVAERIDPETSSSTSASSASAATVEDSGTIAPATTPSNRETAPPATSDSEVPPQSNQETGTATGTRTLRIFISSPGDVDSERYKAKQVIAQLQKFYGSAVSLVPVLWEDLPLTFNASFQDGIDMFLSNDKGIDIAVFILWARLGTPVQIGDKTYRSGTEREYDLMRHALYASGGERPEILFYQRRDEDGFTAKFSDPENKDQLAELIEQRNLAESFIQENGWNEKGQNIGAYHSFHQPVEFAGRLKVHLQGLINQKLEDSGLNREARWTDDPYRGLEAFNQEHADIFFGREEEIVDLESRLRDREQEEQPCAFVAVIGASGSGKSSLVRAGLRASLTRFNLDESISKWHSTVMMPGQAEGNPTRYLLECLTSPGSLPKLTQGGLSLDELVENLVESPDTTINLTFQPLFKGTEKSRPRLLVIVDQFEELFTDKRISVEDRDAFLLTLEGLAQSGFCWVVTTMRSDFYPVAQKSEIFLRLKGEKGQFDLQPPGPEALRRIITEPARMAGISFEKRPPELGGQSVVGRILEDARDEADMLPLLSDLLFELDRHRTENTISFEAYENLGGLEGALSQRAENEFARLTKEQQAACPEILHALVTVEADADVRRPANLKALCDTRQKAALVNAFIDARLLTADGPTVSLAHEALLRKWDRIAEWVDDNRQHLQVRSRVEQAMRLWRSRDCESSLLLSEGVRLAEGAALLQDAPHLLAGSEYEPMRDFIRDSDEHHTAQARRSKRIRGFVMAGLSLLTLIALAGGGVAWMQKQEADRALSGEKKQKEAAVLATAVAEEEKQKAVKATAVAEEEKQKAVEATAVAENEKQKTAQALEVVEQQKLQSDITAGEGFLYRALNHKDSNDAAFYAARAVGFEGFGKPSTTNAFDSEDQPELFPRYFSPVGSRTKSNNAIFKAEAAKTHPFLWASVVTSFHSNTVMSIAFSPDGETFASGSADSSIILWDSNTGEAITIFKRHSNLVSTVAFSPDGETLASGSWDNSIILWDVSTGDVKGSLMGHSGKVMTVAFSPDGKTIASGSKDQTIRLWDLQRKEEMTLKYESDPINSLAFSPDGKTLASGTADGSIALWTIDGGEKKMNWHGHLEAVSSVTFSPDGETLASGSTDNKIRLWNVIGAEAKAKATLIGHSEPVFEVAFSPDGQTLASASWDKSIILWDVNSEETKATLIGHSDPVFSLAFSPNGETLASGSGDKTVRLWSVDSGKEKSDLKDQSYEINCIAISPDGSTLASGSGGSDFNIRIWDMSSGKIKGILRGHSDNVNSIAFSPDGKTLASVAGGLGGSGEELAEHEKDSFELLKKILGSSGAVKDHTIRLWDLDTGKEKAILTGHSENVWCVAFSPDGKNLASGSGDHTIRLWDVNRGREMMILKGHEDSVESLAYSPDGEILATGSDDCDIRLWDASTGAKKAVLTGHSESVGSVIFSPDGQTIASGSSYQNGIRLWNVSNGETRTILKGHSDDWFGVFSLAFSPNGETLASGASDNSIILWDLFKGEPKATLKGHSDSVNSVVFSPDGETLASGSHNSIRLWSTTNSEARGTFREHVWSVNSVDFNPDGSTLAVGTGNIKEIRRLFGAVLNGTEGEKTEGLLHNIYLWNIRSGESNTIQTGHSGSLTSVVFSPDGETLASGSFDKSIRLSDVKSGIEKAVLNGHSDVVQRVIFSPDGEILASGSLDNSIRLWNLTGETEQAILTGHSDIVTALAFSPGGATLASGSSDNSIRLWDGKYGWEEAIFTGHSDTVSSVAFSPDGKVLASGSFDNTIRLWDVKSGKSKAILSGHSDDVNCVAFNSNGKLLATGSADNCVALWDVHLRTLIAVFRGHSGAVNSVAFSRDGQTLASGSQDGEVKIWDTKSIHSNLFIYLNEGWCSFDSFQELVWNEPEHHLFGAIVAPFRNVPKYSSLGTMMHPEHLISKKERFRRERFRLPTEPLSLEEKNWRLYIKAIEAENWATAEIYYDRLSEANQSRPHANVIWALTEVIPEQMKAAMENESPKLAVMRLRSARRFASRLRLPNQHRDLLEMLKVAELESIEKPESKSTKKPEPQTVRRPASQSIFKNR